MASVHALSGPRIARRPRSISMTESNAPKRLFIGSSPHEQFNGDNVISSDRVIVVGRGRRRRMWIPSYGVGGGTRASSPDVDPHRDDAGPSREEQVHSRPLPSPPDVDPHRGGVGGGTRASSAGCGSAS